MPILFDTDLQVLRNEIKKGGREGRSEGRRKE